MITINGFEVHDRIGGWPVNYNRRRYARKTYTWVKFYDGTAWQDLGDPWPVVTPKKTEIAEAIARKVSKPTETSFKEIAKEVWETIPESEAS